MTLEQKVKDVRMMAATLSCDKLLKGKVKKVFINSDYFCDKEQQFDMYVCVDNSFEMEDRLGLELELQQYYKPFEIHLYHVTDFNDTFYHGFGAEVWSE